MHKPSIPPRRLAAAIALALATAITVSAGTPLGGTVDASNVVPSADIAGAEPDGPLAALAIAAFKATLSDDATLALAGVAQLELLSHLPAAEQSAVDAVLLAAFHGAVAGAERPWHGAVRPRVAAVRDALDRRIAALAVVPAAMPDGATRDWRAGVHVPLAAGEQVVVTADAPCRIVALARDDAGRPAAMRRIALEAGETVLSLQGASVMLRDVAGDCTGTALDVTSRLRPLDLTEDGPMIVGQPYRVVLAEGESRVMALQTRKGQAVMVRTYGLAPGTDTTLEVHDAANRKAGGNDDASEDLSSRTLVIGEGALMSVTLGTVGSAGGEFTVVAEVVDARPLPNGEPITFTSEPEWSWFRVDAAASAVYELELTAVDKVDPAMQAFLATNADAPHEADDAAPGTLDARMRLVLEAGQSAWIRAGTRSTEGTLRLHAKPVGGLAPLAGHSVPFATAAPGDLAALAAVPAGMGTTTRPLAFDAEAGATYLLAAPVEGVSFEGQPSLRFVGEHLSMHMENAVGSSRIGLTCWKAEHAGPARFVMADDVPRVVAAWRLAPNSGWCPDGAESGSGMSVAASLEPDRAPAIEIGGPRRVSVPTGASKAWLRLRPGLQDKKSGGLALRVWDAARPTGPEALGIRLLDGLSRTPLDESNTCGGHHWALETGRDYLVEISGTQDLPPELLLEAIDTQPDPASLVGQSRIVGRHYIRAGSANWATSMEPFVGRTARIVEVVEDSGSEMLVRLDVDEGRHVWRLESLVPVVI